MTEIKSGQIWRHKKTGGTYQVINANAMLQCSAAPEFESMFEDDCFTVYQSRRTGAYFVRPTEEFADGRFELINTQTDIMECLTEKAERAGLRVKQCAAPANQDATTFLLISKVDPTISTSISISGLEELQACGNAIVDLIDSRFSDAVSRLRKS